MNPALPVIAATAAPDPAGRDPLASGLVRQLDAAADALSHDVSERLRASRVRAVAMRKRGVALPAGAVRGPSQGPVAHGAERLGWFGWIGSVVPVFALVIGMALLHESHNEDRASEVAEVDSALLVDEVPPVAYSDPGFLQFLRLESDAAD